MDQLFSLAQPDPISRESLSAHIQAMNDRSSSQSSSSSLSLESSAASTSSLFSVPSTVLNPSKNLSDLLATGSIRSPLQSQPQANSVIVTAGNAVSRPPDRMPSASHRELRADVDAVTPRIATNDSLRVSTRRTEPINQGTRAGQVSCPSSSRSFSRPAISAYEARMVRYARHAQLMHAKLREETRETISFEDAKEKLDELLEEWPFSASSALHQETLPSILIDYVSYKKAPSRWKGPKPRDQMHLLLAHVKTWMADQLIRGTLKVIRIIFCYASIYLKMLDSVCTFVAF